MNLILECAAEVAKTYTGFEKRVVIEMIDVLANTDLTDEIVPEIKRRIGLADTFYDSAVVGRVMRKALREAKAMADTVPLTESLEEV